MTVTDQEVERAEAEMAALRDRGFALAARYDHQTDRIVIDLSTGIQIAFPPRLAEGLGGAAPDDLAEIEVSPAGLGLHWPRIDADLYVPAILDGVLGSKQWMAAQHTADSHVRTTSKANPARNGHRETDRRKAAIS